ncbi:hypothetical protein [Variovorax durovernensis]
MQTRDAMQAARLAQLEGAILGLMRDAEEDGLDGLSIVATADDGQVVIDLQCTANGVPLSGESL